MSHYQKASFVLSVAQLKQLPPDEGIEVAIVGRSNAGKSSVLNKITQNKNLARVSKTPGRTQMINIFSIDTTRRLADLPGYGYAKVPAAARQHWEKLLSGYLSTRKSLRGVIVVMDIRHPFKDLDFKLLEYCAHYGLAVHILLNKADKLSKSACAKVMQEAKKAVAALPNEITFQAFSALKGTGVRELQVLLDEWYGFRK